jgi:hypothetical protein
MPSLEDEIETLDQLDKLRISSAALRDEGRKALLERPTELWESAGDAVEDALVVKALCPRTPAPLPREVLPLINGLEQMRLEEFFDTEKDQVPILRAARTMQALVATPDSAFSEAVLFSYYRVVREIYSADAPDWTIGGARAGEAGAATAFVTGECIRAILGLARALENTGTFVAGLGNMFAQTGRLGPTTIPEAWYQAEIQRLHINFYTTIKKLTGNLTLKLLQPTDDLSPATIDSYFEAIPSDLIHALDRSIATFDTAWAAVARYRLLEGRRAKSSASDSDLRRFERSLSGHTLGLSVLKKAGDRAREVRALFPQNPDERSFDVFTACKKLAKMFHDTAYEVRKLIHPARNFMSAVLDRELAAVSRSDNARWDPGEMLFAAVSYGAATDEWNDERLIWAGQHLAGALSERGRFPAGRPIHSKPQGYKLQIFGGELLRAFAQLMQNVEAIPADVKLVRRMLLFFEDTRVRFAAPLGGWYHEGPQHPIRPDRSVTAVAVLALNRINRMLDQRINTEVLRHFSVKQPKPPKLENLFYGDYGLSQAPQEIARKESVAVVLERMRAHVAGVKLPSAGEPLYSMVLHGPPGTGKTTLIEALAASCEVPLVEVTPSDIVMGGQEAIERRARAVFKALSLLTRAVILFDEFDPVLRRRGRDGATPTVFSFLTPGMLPKLKTLNKLAKRRSVSYALITNLIGTLDEASVRSGRFDSKLGIYPPDPLSRAGYLWAEVLEFCQECGKAPLPDLRDRILEVVRNSAGASMQILGSPGWFVRPKDWNSLSGGTPFSYLCNFQSPAVDWSEPEAQLEEFVIGHGKDAELEYRQWAWITAWEEVFMHAGVQLDQALQAFPGNAPEARFRDA